MEKYKTYIKSPIGVLQLTSDGSAIDSLSFATRAGKDSPSLPDCLVDAKKQIKEYFAGKRKSFDLPIAINGTKFQTKVWNQLCEIKSGTVASYKDVAEKIGNPEASRAVGMANNKNPIAIIVPCHRVVGSNGNLVGYAGGLWRKKWLLEHEKRA